MKEHPILMSGPLVRATLSGLKTQTRRLFKVRGCGTSRPVTLPTERVHYDGQAALYSSGDYVSPPYPCPFGAVGDHLWIRETWTEAEGILYYRATDREINEDERLDGMCWRPSIHMPRRASRLTLEVTAIRVERLQDISEEDAQAEGIEQWKSSDPAYTWVGGPEKRGQRSAAVYCHKTARDAFATLWDSLAPAAAKWADNPWVWAIGYQKVSP